MTRTSCLHTVQISNPLHLSGVARGRQTLESSWLLLSQMLNSQGAQLSRTLGPVVWGDHGCPNGISNAGDDRSTIQTGTLHSTANPQVSSMA